MYSPTDSVPEPPPSALRLYYITDRSQFSGSNKDKERQLFNKIEECSTAGIDWIQLREKDLSPRALAELAHQAMAAIQAGSSTRLLINSRTDIALASGAHGVHLPASGLTASEARAIMVRAGKTTPVIGVSTHSPAEVALAEAHGADFAVFGPVFEKGGKINPTGFDQLRQACRRPRVDGTPMPLLALGGIDLKNATLCFDAGATGIAGIRVFQNNAVEQVVARLRSLFRQ